MRAADKAAAVHRDRERTGGNRCRRDAGEYRHRIRNVTALLPVAEASAELTARTVTVLELGKQSQARCTCPTS